LINIQGLTKSKAAELVKIIEENDILCLTETQQKLDSIDFGRKIIYETSMRNCKDKKGGGLMILHRNKNIEIIKVENTHPDVLIVRCKVYNISFKVMLIYMSVTDIELNHKLLQQIQNNIDIKENYIVLGDFNGHTGYLGSQDMNKNGKLMLDFAEENSLIILNGHTECNGTITWESRGRQSVIDYILINDGMHKQFIKMDIDEARDIFDLSDHNLLTAEFVINTSNHKEFSNQICKEIKYLKINEETTQEFLNILKGKINNETSLENYEHIINEAKENSMTRSMKRRISNRNEQEEKIWFNKDIEKEIKLRKAYNRQMRNEQQQEKKNELKEMYLLQKKKTQQLVRNEISKHERKITNDIRKEKGHKKLWEIVNTLRGKKRNENKKEKLYDEQHKELEESKWSEQIINFWRKVYQKHDNNINEEWNERISDEYRTNYTQGQSFITNDSKQLYAPSYLQEHLDATGKIIYIGYMEDPQITVEDVKIQMKKTKKKKSPGPDGIKPDIIKIIGDDPYCTQIMAHGMNRIVNNIEDIPRSWSESKTVLVPKKKQPTVKDLRPIALTNATYKLFVGILKTKIEQHIRHIKQENEVQAGFTKNRRIADNLFILDYCIQECIKKKKPLFLISIDFAKAFDSIKRNMLMFVLKKYLVHPKIIDIIAKIYKNDTTRIYFNDMYQDDIKVTSGIRQGCNGSSNLFLLITYHIIETMYEKLDGINTEICKIVALFFADDGLILMQSLKEAKDSIRTLTSIAQECGLDINKKKSNILIYNYKEQPEEIEGIKVTDNIIYLGINIQNKKDCFKLHRKDSIKKARKYSNLMPAVIAKSCNKLLIGKTFWKCAALPSILHGSEIIHYNKNYIDDLQKEENKAFRYTVHAAKGTAISALRGEIGTSLQVTRDMKCKILYVKHILQHNNLLKEIFTYQFEQKKETKWIQQIKTYMKELNINLSCIENMSNTKIKMMTKEFDDKLWKKDILNKSTLKIYRKYKHEIKDEQDIYDNTAASVTLFRARTGTLLRDFKRPIDDKICILCKEENEDIQHFLLKCSALITTRKTIIELQRPYNKDYDDIIAEFLLFGRKTEEIVTRNREDLQKLWQHRNRILSHT